MSTGYFIAIIGTVLVVIAYVGMLALKEYYCSQTLLANKKRREEEDYNHWLHTIGLHETSYYFNSTGIRRLNYWLLWNKDVL